MVQSHIENEFCPFSLENENEALNWPLNPLKTLQISAVEVGMGEWNDILKAGLCFSWLVSPQAGASALVGQFAS